ncbi:MAG: DUF6340 family protein [Bacteroidota bacterium]|nr:hypothetical protein [Odoribacter sp.]MDP3643546.1 DUF6340 family protein [Bacteroidota bacterium]
MQYFNQFKSYQAFILILAGIALASCKSNFAVLTIENSRPANEELPTDIQSITLMNRSMNTQFENYREDSLQVYFYRKGFQLSKIVLDSVASDTTIRALAELLFESGRYDVVVPLERNLRREFIESGNYGILSSIERNISKELSYEQLPDTLNPFIVKKICSDFNTDALLVLERFSNKVMADYSFEKVGVNDYHYASVDVKYDAFFRIYKPGKKTLVKEIELIDTIYWESSDYNQVRLFSKLPSVKQALINAGIKIALEVDKKLSPTWTSERRGYFLFSPKNDRGQQLMNDNNYDEASKYWTEMAQSTNKKIRSKAEYNLALMSELSGDIDGALEWGLKSFYSYYRHQTEAYLKKLKARKETQQKTK